MRETDFAAYVAALFDRYLDTLTPADLGRGAKALKARYLARQGGEQAQAALGTRAKRAAFALLYGPLHLLAVHEVAKTLPRPAGLRRILDLGCGTGAAGAALALAWGEKTAQLVGVDRDAWALGEARVHWRLLGLRGRTERRSLETDWRWPPADVVVVAFALNELPEAPRTRLVAQLLARHTQGTAVLVVEPVARQMAPFWPALAALGLAQGGQVAEHRFVPVLPERLRLLRRQVAKADEVTLRSLYLPPASGVPVAATA